MALSSPITGVAGTMLGLLNAMASASNLSISIYANIKLSNYLPLNNLFDLNLRSFPAFPRFSRIFWEQFCLPGILKKEQINLLHAPAYVAPLATDCPFVLTVHDLHVFTHPQFCKPTNRWHYRIFMPASIKHAKAIITFSEYVKKTLIEYFPSTSDRIVVIPPGIDSDMSPLQKNKISFCPVKLPERYLLFVGDLAPRKNIRRLLLAFDQIAGAHKDLHLVFCGQHIKSNAVEIKQTLHAIKHNDRVILAGYVHRAWLPTIYANALALVFPSFDEGFGLPVLEAMACGCPVITSHCGGPEEICGPAAIYCDAVDSESIADSIHMMLSQNASTENIIELGLKRAAEFNWNKAALQTEQLYQNLTI